MTPQRRQALLRKRRLEQGNELAHEQGRRRLLEGEHYHVLTGCSSVRLVDRAQWFSDLHRLITEEMKLMEFVLFGFLVPPSLVFLREPLPK